MIPLATWWRRSIGLRIVTGTVVLTAIVVMLTTTFLLASISDGLTDNRVDAAIGEAQSGFSYAQQSLDASIGADRNPSGDDLIDVIDQLVDRSGPDRRFEVVMEGPLIEDSERPVRSSSIVARAAVPPDLVFEVENTRGTLWTYTSMQVDGETVPALAVGSQIQIPRSGDSFAMYYVFDLSDISATLDFVRRTVLIASLSMVVLVGAVAWLMSRQVLAPVRLVREAAERYSSGRLEERLAVKGEDDIARLSSSFNQMAANLEQQIRQLEELGRLQRQFVSDVSHELRTPLTTVSMASELLHERRDDFDAEMKRSIELLKTELDHYQRLLVDLLEVSQFDAGAAVLDALEVDLVSLARKVVENIGRIPQSMTVTVECAEPSLLAVVDRRRIERILRNLVGNAVAHSSARQVRVVIAQDAGLVSIVVEDDGVGIQASERDLVFERFWRADPSRTGEGTGLGLAIAREDAELHGGSLELDDHRTHGTRFILTLPQHPSGGPDDAPREVNE